MDMRQYASKYIKPDHVRDGSIRTRIVNVFESEQYGRPVLELETGSMFTLNETNNDILVKAWGYDSDGWIGPEKEIELVLSTYKDWKSDQDKETVKVVPIPPAKMAQQNGGAPANKPLPPSIKSVAQGGPASLRGEMDDEIPFACEWR
jgi:hypothetical protein